MRREKAKPVSEVLQEYLRQEGLETPLAEHRLIASWPQAVGRLAASYTTSLEIRSQVLYVSVNSSALRQELLMGRRILVEKLNTLAGSPVICDIVIR